MSARRQIQITLLPTPPEAADDARSQVSCRDAVRKLCKELGQGKYLVAREWRIALRGTVIVCIKAVAGAVRFFSRNTPSAD